MLIFKYKMNIVIFKKCEKIVLNFKALIKKFKKLQKKLLFYVQQRIKLLKQDN